MDLNELRNNIDHLWREYSEAPKGDKTKAEMLFLKVKESGQLTFSSGAEVSKKLFRPASFDFEKNAVKMKELLEKGEKDKAALKPEERAHLKELQDIYNKMVVRYEKKSTPGVLGRLLMKIGIFSQDHYKEKIGKAIAQKQVHCNFDLNVAGRSERFQQDLSAALLKRRGIDMAPAPQQDLSGFSEIDDLVGASQSGPVRQSATDFETEVSIPQSQDQIKTAREEIDALKKAWRTLQRETKQERVDKRDFAKEIQELEKLLADGKQSEFDERLMVMKSYIAVLKDR